MSRLLKIGSRRSALAKLQSYHVAARLRELYPDLKIEFVFKESMGDKDLVTPLWQMGDRGVFTKDFVADLLEERVDVVIHSWKDLDLKDTEGTEVLSVLPRADQRDLFLFKKSALLSVDYDTIRIFSSSPRREYNLVRFFQKALPASLPRNISFEPVRGNISTRMKKWLDSDLQGMIVAKAALDRLLAEDFPESTDEEYSRIRQEIREALRLSVFMCLPLSENPNAPAQGALAAEVKTGREDILKIIRSIASPGVAETVMAERNILKKYGGGCHQKIGVACIKRDYGTATWLRGLADSGEVLNEFTFVSGSQHPKAKSSENIWPLTKTAVRFERREIAADYPATDIWVSRSNAWKSEWSQQDYAKVVWASGLKTMYDLAAKNVWVHGSSESLGEKEDPGVDLLLGRSPQFTKITHNNSENIDSAINRLCTYELGVAGDIPDLTGKTHFFWMSGHQFDLVFAKNPAIADGYHSCGPGITRDHLRKRLGDSAKIDVYLKFEDWLDYNERT